MIARAGKEGRRRGVGRSIHRLLLAAVIFPPVAAAQDSVYAPLAAQLGVSVRALGMGGGWIAVREADALFVNPAFAGLSTQMAVGGGRYRDVASLVHAASSINMGGPGLAFGVTALDYGAAPGGVTPWSSLGARGAQDALSTVATGAGSMTWHGLRFGAAAKLVHQRAANLSGSAASFDAGVGKDAGRWQAGLAVQNLGAKLEVDGAPMNQPLRAALGASAFGYSVGPFDAGLMGGVSVRRDGFVAAGGGAELAFVPLDGYTVAVRAGVRRPEAPSLNPVTLGLTFGLDRFSLDYAFEDIKGAGVAHHLALRVR
jgi:hypothetical protein